MTSPDEQMIISVIFGDHSAHLSVLLFYYVFHEHLTIYSSNSVMSIGNLTALVIISSLKATLKGWTVQVEMRKNE